MIIYVEGLSGAGKTSLLNILKSKSNVIVIDEFLKPYERFNLEENKVEAWAVLKRELCQENDENKYKAAHDADTFENYVFVDRSHMSTLVYETAKEFNKKHTYSATPVWDWYNTEMDNNEPKIGKPDLYVLINTTSLDIRARWKQGKAEYENDDWHKDHELMRFFYDRLFAFEGDIPVLEFDNNTGRHSKQLDLLTNNTNTNNATMANAEKLYNDVVAKLERIKKIKNESD